MKYFERKPHLLIYYITAQKVVFCPSPQPFISSIPYYTPNPLNNKNSIFEKTVMFYAKQERKLMIFFSYSPTLTYNNFYLILMLF